MKQPNRDKIRTLREKETYKYLGILEADTIKQVEMKDKIQKEYLRRTRLQMTCCHLNSIERHSANADVKNSQGVIRNWNLTIRTFQKLKFDHTN